MLFAVVLMGFMDMLPIVISLIRRAGREEKGSEGEAKKRGSRAPA